MTQSIGFTVDESVAAMIKQQADLEGASFSAVARRYLESGMTAPASSEPAPITLQDAAKVIVAALPEGYGALIRELCAAEGHEEHEYVISHCTLAWERNETALLIGAEDRKAAAVPATLPAPAQGETRACDYCKKPFVVTRQGQKFCPPTNEEAKGCGRLAAEAELHAKRPQQMSRQHQIARKHGFLPGDAAPVSIPQTDLVAAMKTALAEMGVNLAALAGKPE